MADKFQNKFRIPSARLQTWDYGSPAWYFITICTANRLHYFGEIENYKMGFTKIGQIAHNEWLKTALLRPDMNLLLGAFQVMPNHFHALIEIGENQYNRNAICQSVGTFKPQSKNLASIIRGFKSAVTQNARILGMPFDWQERFYDHIVRDCDELKRIEYYIQNNVTNWVDDEFVG